VAGALFGLACIMKQQGVVFGFFAATWLLWRGVVEQGRGARNLRAVWPRVAFLAVGGTLALLSMVIALAIAGVYDRFWHWTVEYAQAYLRISTFSKGIENFFATVGRLWAAAALLWLLAALGMVLLWWEPTLRRGRFFLAMFAAFSFAGVCPGFYFRSHYFLLVRVQRAVF
jgi:hypothetical protein